MKMTKDQKLKYNTMVKVLSERFEPDKKRVSAYKNFHEKFSWYGEEMIKDSLLKNHCRTLIKFTNTNQLKNLKKCIPMILLITN